MIEVLGMARGEVFTGTLGRELGSQERSWFVTPLIQDCEAGKWGKAGLTALPPMHKANERCEYEESKVQAFIDGVMAGDTEVIQALTKPVIVLTYGGMCWLVDGHHRVETLHRLGVKDIAVYVLPEGAGDQYLID